MALQIIFNKTVIPSGSDHKRTSTPTNKTAKKKLPSIGKHWKYLTLLKYASSLDRISSIPNCILYTNMKNKKIRGSHLFFLLHLVVIAMKLLMQACLGTMNMYSIFYYNN